MVLNRSGEPLTLNLPGSHSRSSSDASRRCAARVRALAWILREAIAVAAPATGVEREAYVPSPYGAVFDLDVLDREAELLGDDLGECRLVALTLGLDADAGQHLAGRVDADLA